MTKATTPHPTHTAQPDLAVQLGSLRLPNPILTASGTCGYAFELIDLTDFEQLGGFVTKSITREPRQGNPPQRTVETASGMLNAIGLANIGLDRFCRERLPLLKRMPVPVIVNVAGKTTDDYCHVARQLSENDTIQALELNVSCPNVSHGGITFGTDPGVLGSLVSAVRKQCPETFLIVKLTPSVTDITVTARAAIDAGANALSLVNTFTAMAIDADKRRPVLGNRTGGLSGPAIKPIALYLVHRVYTEVAKPAGIPIIGLGGIVSASDAIEFLIAGATAVSIGTNVLVDPGCLMRIKDGIAEYLKRHQIDSLSKLIGSLG